jgi:exodeoxyribonuclease VII small subunit
MEAADMTFEQRLEQVKSIIERIEGGQQSLEDSVLQYESGIRILNDLEKELSEMKRRITVLQERPDGSLAETPMEDIP